MVHSFMMGTAEWCSPAENVLLIQQMEEENIKLAVRNGFSGIFTNNSSELTHVWHHIVIRIISVLLYASTIHSFMRF